jgi:putative ABC transport system ATP-binding protein
MSDATALVRLEGVSKYFDEGGQRRVVLRELSASFERGEAVAIVGRSGSGKSTLLNLLSGIDLPSSGKIVVGGQELTRLGERERTLFRRRAIGFVFQFFNLIPTLTVMENLLLPLELNNAADARGRARTLELLDQVGMADRAATYPDRLSGGEQQRVAVARALVHDPLLVLADEPTGNLDAETSAQVARLLDKLTRQAGKNLVLVTHSAELAATTDRIFRMHEGHLEEALLGIHEQE